MSVDKRYEDKQLLIFYTKSYLLVKFSIVCGRETIQVLISHANSVK